MRGDQFYTTVSVSDATARQTYPDVKSFFDGRYHYLGEVGWTPKFSGNNEREYKATLSYTSRMGDPNDIAQRESYGLILGGHQDLCQRIRRSARWSKSFERFNSGLQEAFVAGFTFTGVGSYKDD